jgi:hypothetical protein
MPARWLTLIAVVFLVPVCVEAQTGSVKLQGHVSETVALSILPNFTQKSIDVNIVNSGSTVRLTLSSTNAEFPVIRVPLLVRSNTSFRVSAEFESNSAVLTQVSVTDVRATGTLVSPAAVSDLEVASQFDPRGLNLSGPLLVLSGPRVSLGGTLDSPNNALQVTILIRMKPQPGRGSLVHLTFTGTAGPLAP